jgi:PAS domain S-box-containing protein
MAESGDQGEQRGSKAKLRSTALLVAVSYYLAALLGSQLSPTGVRYVTFWLPAGVYLAALLVTRRAEWPWVILGALVGNWAFDLSAGTPLILFPVFDVLNTLTALVGAQLFQRFVNRDSSIDNFRDLFGLVWVAALTTGGAGVLGSAALVSMGFANSFIGALLGWWGGCAIAIFVIVPVAVVWFSKSRWVAPPAILIERVWELLLAWSILLSVTIYLLVFDRGIMAPYKGQLFPILLWIGIRFGLHGATLTGFLLSLVFSYLTTHFGVGLSAEELSSGSYVFLLQTYLCVAVLVTIVPALAIAERERALRELKDSEERLRQLAGAAFEAICISENGKIVDGNDQALRMFGLTREEFLGREIFEFIAPEARETVAAAVRENRESAYEHMLLRKDGTRFYGEAQARVVELGGRKLRMTALRDVTDRKRAEAELRASEAVLRQFVKHAPAAIAIMDANMCYVQTSDRWLQDYNLGDTPLIGRSHYDVFPHVPERWKQSHQRVLDGSVERNDEDPFERADGVTEWLQWEARPWRRADGTIAGLIFFTQLITERKRAEEIKLQSERHQRELEAQLRQAQKMEAVGTLAGGIAHDFNNILGAIIAHAELSRLDHPDDLELQSNLGQVLQSSHRAASLVQQILTFSRRQPQERRNISLVPIVREALQMLRSTLPTTIAFDEQIDATVPSVLADATQIHQVVVNLCTNAGHAMRGKQGTLTVRVDLFEHTAPATIAGLALGRYVRLAVQDTGHGVRPDLVQRIFEPFFTTKPAGEGSGLGLAVVHGIVQEHAGAISVTSDPGSGARFTVHLPVGAGTATSLRSPQARIAAGQGQHILLVDDERSLADATSRLLGRYGYRLTVFNDSAEALAAFEAASSSFHLIITDLTMPRMTGPELAVRVRQLSKSIPIILTTGSRTDLSNELAREMGIAEVFVKPLDFPALLAAIRRLLEPSEGSIEAAL